MNTNTNNVNENEIYFKLKGKNFNPYLCILVTVLSTLVQILSSSGNDNSSIIITLYFNIILIFITIYRIGIYGVIAGVASSLIFSLTVKQSWINVTINVCANLVQALLFYFFCKRIKSNANKSEENVIPQSKIIILLLGFLYFLYNICADKNYEITSLILFILLVFTHAFVAISKKDKDRLLLLLFLILPNIVGALIGSIQFDDLTFKGYAYFSNVCTWFFSNTILLLSFGYILLSLIKPKQAEQKQYLTIKLSTVMFFVSTILWNTIIYVLFFLGWLNKSVESYVFPWFVGNLFFILNTYYSVYKETSDEGQKEFDWFEKRAIVAEKNTQMLVAIISFLLPICTQLLGTITHSISILFILNITSAIISIGLIWIPNGKNMHMALIKHLKTNFHLFTLSLLLLNIVLIINESIGV